MVGTIAMMQSLDVDRLAREFQTAKPFPHVKIDGFLDEDFARAVAASYPSFDEANALGRQFEAVNEYRKIQITDAERFPEPVAQLNAMLASPEFLEALERITGVPKLLADATLAGGGIHITGPRGRLDVHVDFNFLPEKKIHRRLNLLLYLNPTWERRWGGAVELWDEKVKVRHHAFEPVMNRCVIFETSETSYHGVEPVTCPPDVVRQSFATYYYTREAPAGYSGKNHSTIFRARPEERFKKYVLMPAERARHGVREARRRVRSVRDRVRAALGR